MGNYVASKRAKKVYQITDSLAMTIAGGVAVAQRIVDILKINARLFEFEKGRPMPVASAARLVSNILFSNRSVGRPLPLQALVGGYDETLEVTTLRLVDRLCTTEVAMVPPEEVTKTTASKWQR